ncbi:hypothetical protein [Actinoplanes couchii]|uniref:Uncharacterized protein n=1 Tax=Actinoplanes couchii TaxID=403638 RepID=A0ABQ3XPP2_9ACTN|nr:hypothetical protein [Actinoplanes couchii]MDR6319112.1 hypothetical protein [Actinoplanes couchii]GID60453.1 hypothetical protein Aco03nite_088570 [Actinoplanes couchii]
MTTGERRIRFVVVTAVVVFAYGTIVHVADLLGLRPALSGPTWLTVYFTSLVVFDPLSAVLLAMRRVSGLYLGCAVLLTDAAANAYANYVLDPATGITAGRIGQAVITLLALALTASAPAMAAWFRRPAPPAPGSPAPVDPGRGR